MKERDEIKEKRDYGNFIQLILDYCLVYIYILNAIHHLYTQIKISN